MLSFDQNFYLCLHSCSDRGSPIYSNFCNHQLEYFRYLRQVTLPTCDNRSNPNLQISLLDRSSCLNLHSWSDHNSPINLDLCSHQLGSFRYLNQVTLMTCDNLTKSKLLKRYPDNGNTLLFDNYNFTNTENRIINLKSINWNATNHLIYNYTSSISFPLTFSNPFLP